VRRPADLKPGAVSIRPYVVTAILLLVFTGLTIGLAFVPLGAWQTPIALTIAAIKALLVALFFMHLRVSRVSTRLAALAGLIWLGILLTGTLDDVITRGWLPVPGR
jgi:cytochrome c oxidase subunit IV